MAIDSARVYFTVQIELTNSWTLENESANVHSPVKVKSDFCY